MAARIFSLTALAALLSVSSASLSLNDDELNGLKSNCWCARADGKGRRSQNA